MEVKSKTLILDIETSPLIIMAWELGEQRINKEQLLEDWHILCFTAKWLGDPARKAVYSETRNGDDEAICQKLHQLFNEADIVITQNGKRFDEPKIKARMMSHGMKPYRPFVHFDTYDQLKDKEFTSHSLDYLTKKFCTKYKKLKHQAFPGLKLWQEIRKGNPAAWREMRKYNLYDVLSTEELYLKTRAWAKKTAPSPKVPSAPIPQCPDCKSYRSTSRGWRGLIQRRNCRDCGKAFSVTRS